jgi:hypothetical protein
MSKKIKNFKLKTSLLRLWFVKNLKVFLQLGVLISILLVFTGNIDSNTPFLGGIFGELSSNIRSILEQDYNSGTLLNLGTVAFTLFITIGTLSARLERIALSDIKSPALKKALIQAGLYFNKEGKLVSKLEVASGIDIDGDGKVGTVDVREIPKERIIDGVKRASEEFLTIINANIEEEGHVEDTIDKANLKDAKEALVGAEKDIEEGLISKLLIVSYEFILKTYEDLKSLFIKNKAPLANPEEVVVDAVSGAAPVVTPEPIAEPKAEDVILPIDLPKEETPVVIPEVPTVETQPTEPNKNISAARNGTRNRLDALKNKYR